MPTATRNGASSERKGQEGDPLTDALTPLLGYRDRIETEASEIEAQIEEIKARLDEKKVEIRRVLKVLREVGLVKPEEKPKSAAGDSMNKDIAPTTDRPNTAIGLEYQERAIKAIEEMKGEPFQIGMIERQTELDRRTIGRAIGYLRGTGRIKLLGHRPQISRKGSGPAKAGRHPMTFQEVV